MKFPQISASCASILDRFDSKMYILICSKLGYLMYDCTMTIFVHHTHSFFMIWPNICKAWQEQGLLENTGLTETYTCTCSSSMYRGSVNEIHTSSLYFFPEILYINKCSLPKIQYLPNRRKGNKVLYIKNASQFSN